MLRIDAEIFKKGKDSSVNFLLSEDVWVSTKASIVFRSKPHKFRFMSSDHQNHSITPRLLLCSGFPPNEVWHEVSRGQSVQKPWQRWPNMAGTQPAWSWFSGRWLILGPSLGVMVYRKATQFQTLAPRHSVPRDGQRMAARVQWCMWRKCIPISLGPIHGWRAACNIEVGSEDPSS